MFQHIQCIQKQGPYNLMGVSWGGALTLEVAQLLEAQGEKTQVILLDGALDTMLNIVEQLREGVKLEIQVLCRVLQINSSKVIMITALLVHCKLCYTIIHFSNS